jgi:L-galactose dehydrogenase/L-glyceraldehyde 3-phosphate reductase
VKIRELGSTGLKISEIGFGCGDVGGLIVRGDPRERTRAVSRAVDLGINYFDTATIYGRGLSETHLGQALKQVSGDVHVGTKVRLAPLDMRDIKSAVVRSAEESLRRLDLECVDLLQLHNQITARRRAEEASVTPEDVVGGVLDAFQALRDQGKIRYFGITALGGTEQLHQVVGSGRLNTAQTAYNLLNPSAANPIPEGYPSQNFGNLMCLAHDHGMGIIVIRALAAGALTGSAQRHPIAMPAVAPIGSGRDYLEDVARAERFQFLVEEGFADSLVEAALRFPLASEFVSTVLVGYSSLEQLELSVEWARRGPLPADALARLPQVWAGFRNL